jgi:RimJ/RimL family protein N-acetyltransferase
MQRLEKEEYSSVRAVARGLADQGMALSALAGVRPAVVLADSASAPTAICIAAPEAGFTWLYFAGSPHKQSFRRELHEWLFVERALGTDVSFGWLTCDSLAWEEYLPEILAPRTTIPDRRLHYEWARPSTAWRSAVPAGYGVLPLDRALFALGIEVDKRVTVWLDANFGSADGFLEHGVGAVAVYEGKVVAWTLADSFVDGLCDLGTETDKAHRRKGLSYAATCLAAELALARGARRIGWHCHAVNAPSVRTAEKAGFELRYPCTMYPVHFDAAQHEDLVRIIADEYAESAHEAVSHGEYAEADRLFTRMRGFDYAPNPQGLYAAAWATAALGAHSRAFSLLDAAVDRGWTDAQAAEAQIEFESLRTDARWPVLVKRIAARTEQGLG